MESNAEISLLHVLVIGQIPGTVVRGYPYNQKIL